MRFYDIIIKDAAGNFVQPSYYKNKVPQSYATSYVNGQTLGAALNVEMNIPLFNYATPDNKRGAWLTIHGISREEISQASNLNGNEIVVYAGMRKGLPLANPALSQAIMVKGRIFQCWGNWIGTDMSLDMVILPDTGTNKEPINLAFSWLKNSPLSQALQTSLTFAFPQYTIKIAISSDLVTSYDRNGIYGNLTDLATMVKKMTQATQYAGIKTLGGAKYAGVDITLKDDVLLVYDGTAVYAEHSVSNPLEIAFQDIIGQPTWLDISTINFKCPMRTDIKVGDYIKLPQSLTIQTPRSSIPQPAGAAPVPSRDKLIFQGTFKVNTVYNFGNFRQADAASWVTVYDAIAAGAT